MSNTHNWLSAKDALKAVATIYAETLGLEYREAVEKAQSVILGKAVSCELTAKPDFFDLAIERIGYDGLPIKECGEELEADGTVPQPFWFLLSMALSALETQTSLHEAGYVSGYDGRFVRATDQDRTDFHPSSLRAQIDWVTGDFSFGGLAIGDAGNPAWRGAATNVQFCKNTLPGASWLQDDVKSADPTTSPRHAGAKGLALSKYQELWDALTPQQRAFSQTQHVRIFEEHYPNNKISRAKVRAFTKGRKRGPRPDSAA